MTNQTTTYNNSGNSFLPLASANGRNAEVNKFLLFLIMMVMGVSGACAQTEITSLSEITDMNGNYKLTADINASGNTSFVKEFTGTLDGDFHTITGLSNAIFTTVNGGTVKNVILDNVSISGSGSYTGAIANVASGAGRIYNCGVLATRNTYDKDGYVKTCSSTISGTTVGSIVGLVQDQARVVNCFSYAEVSGTTVAGIVGTHSGTAMARTSTTDFNPTDGHLIFNCVFWGKLTGTNKYPIFGGDDINNVWDGSNATTGINTYNYFLTNNNPDYSGVNSAAATNKAYYFNRFNLYRDILNSHRDLCAMYVFKTQSFTAAQKKEIALWDYSKETKETIPFLHLERLVEGTKRTLERTIPTTAEDYHGKEIRRVSCTFIINDRTFTESLPITDMDTLNYDFTWGKIVLPFANEFSGWTLPESGSTNFGKTITGWEIKSITGGTAGDAPTAANHYNFCDPNNTAKDLYDNTKYVWAQGGNYVVPNGVTDITFTAHIRNAYYLCDPYPDEGFNSIYQKSVYLGTQLTGDTYNGKKIYHTFEDVYKAMGNATNPADQAIVLVGNYHLSTYRNNNTKTDQNVWKNANSNNPYQDKAATIMSIDADNNQVPDYAFVSAVTYSTGRAFCPPTRFDFVCCPGLGITTYTRNGALPDIAIMHSAGWFEVTETSYMHLTEYEVRPQGFKNDNSPCILNGGIYEKFIFGSNLGKTGDNNKFAYFKFGGNVYITDFNPGHKGESGESNVKHNPKPVNVCGGQIDLLCMSGMNYGFTQEGDSYFFSNGGYIKRYQGANQAQLKGNITTQIHHAFFDEYYGGGIVAKYEYGQITGNISNTINDSYVKFYVAGPKFGDMAPDKTVTTVANGTTFGEYYGAGYGGTSLVQVRAKEDPKKFGSTDVPYGLSWNDFKNVRLKYNLNYGTGVSCERRFFIYAGGGVPNSNNNGVQQFLNEYATLSLAKTNNISSTLTNCTVENNYYGGGCQGMVDGTITNKLTGCNVKGSVFGGGYKASVTPITVFSTTEPTKSEFKSQLGIFTDFGVAEKERYTWVSGTDGKVDNTNKTIGTSVNMTLMGNVTGEITTTIDGGTVGEDVYGGGNESPSGDKTNVIIQGTATVRNNVYGGGALANVDHGTLVVIKGGTINGDVYGGGKGEENSEKAKVKGNTKVIVDSEWTPDPTPTPAPQP